jgi:NAD(P)-dependent dehydrogenase (short-subunit alcohol dehydrogenase family)
MRNPLRPEVVVVTGASAGVGRAVVREFGRRGARVGLIARGVDGLHAAAREVEELGGKALVLPLDVSDAEGLEKAAGAVESEFGPIDIWINDAMVSVFSPVPEMPPEEYRRVTEVTFLGSVFGTLAALRRMLPRDRGKIVQVGSALAYRGIPLQSAYCAAKHALQGFCDSLWSELLHDRSGVSLTMVQLPALNTPQFEWVKTRLPGRPRPLGTIFQPEVAARAIHWAAHHRRRELYVGLETVKAIEGNKVAAWLGDQLLAHQGYEGQVDQEPPPPGRRDNLWEPVPGDHGAHGRFDDQARSSSPQTWLAMHRGLCSLLAVGAALAIGARTLLGRPSSAATGGVLRRRGLTPTP